MTSALQATMDPSASPASAPAQVSTMAPVTVRQDSACVEQDLKGNCVIGALPATSTTPCASCVAAVLLGRCQEAVTPLGGVSARPSLQGHGVSSAAPGTTPTPTAMLAPATPGVLWTTTAAQLASADAM